MPHERISRRRRNGAPASNAREEPSIHIPSVRRLRRHLAQVSVDAAYATGIAEATARRLDATVLKVAEIDFELTARPYTADGRGLECTDPDGARYLGFEADSSGSYATFEDTFRGTEEFIREQLRPYVDLLAGHGPVLDLGCGRGELLALLREAGVDATGVDMDASMLDRARAAGLDVVQGEALGHLAALPDASLGGVISIQVIEHLSVADLRTLVAEAHRVLRPGGVLVAETVNPHSPAALKVFWLDLTHVRPLFPESLLLLAHELGFHRGRILFPGGTGDLDHDLRNRGAFALVAYR